MPAPVRYPSGVSTSPRKFMYGAFPAPTPVRLYQYVNDFSTYAAADWTVTSSSSGTSALAAGLGGLLVQTTAAANNDIQANQFPVTSFAFVSGAQLWFNINVNFSQANTALYLAGLANDFSTMAPTDGVYFSKPSGATTMNLVLRASSTSTTIAVGTIAAATNYSFGFHYDGQPSPTLYVYSSIGQTAATAFGQPFYPGGQIVAAAGTNSANALTNLPTAALTMGFGVKAGSVAVKTMTTDYVVAAQEVLTRF